MLREQEKTRIFHLWGDLFMYRTQSGDSCKQTQGIPTGRETVRGRLWQPDLNHLFAHR